jgi:uncharacterized protein (TIGR02145 family)
MTNKNKTIFAAVFIVLILLCVTIAKAQEKKIGNQNWTIANLNVSTFRNGDVIPEAKTNAEWLKAIEDDKPAWCYYNNDPANGEKYGKLYNWFAVNDKRGLAPDNWHVPTSAEWNTLTDYLGGSATAGTKLKSKSGWTDVNGITGNGTNSSGFEGLPGGYRGTDGAFHDIGILSVWWCIGERALIYASDRRLSSDGTDVTIYGDYGRSGFSVRCLRD